MGASPKPSDKKAKGPSAKAAKSETPKELPVVVKSFAEVLLDCLHLLNAGVAHRDTRQVLRALRNALPLRRQFDRDAFKTFVTTLFPEASRMRELILDTLPSLTPPEANVNLTSQVADSSPTMKSTDLDLTASDGAAGDVATADKSKEGADSAALDAATPLSISGSPDGVDSKKHSQDSKAQQIVKPSTSTLRQSDFEASAMDAKMLLSTLFLTVVIDRRLRDKAYQTASLIFKELTSFTPNKRIQDHIAAKAFFFSGLAYELAGKLSETRSFAMIALRSVALHREAMSHVTILNLLLRGFVADDLYDQAIKFIDKAPFPDNLRSNSQHARYLYYLARVNAVRMDYGEAHSNVTLAIRKAPQEGCTSGKAFRLAAHKLNVVVELLMGDIPERQLFNQKDIRLELIPYAKIVQAVRSGDLASFQQVLTGHKATFSKDSNLVLVERLHHCVIRAGLRKINTSYSQISLADVGAKLGLTSVEDTECIVSKAIADGVIDALIDFKTKTLMQLKEGVQAMEDPRTAFHGRIAFCLELHCEAVKAMQYPEIGGSNSSKIEEAEARRKEHQEQLARVESNDFKEGDGDIL